MKKTGLQHHMDTLGALLLFGVFAVCVLAVLLTGADAYRGLTQRNQEAGNRRSCVQYIATKVRQSDSLGAVSVENFGGVDALVLGEGEYITRIYCYDGSLMELFADAALPMEPEDGEKVIALDWLEMSLQDDLLTIEVLDIDGQVSTLLLSLRSGEEAAA
ncbi:MAG: DUF4860 domain-containing protein [Oscillospiraceae bacterium]|nr:DUF4860 domain-containing protein [Oscillospiraceae bacterium]